MRTWCLLALMTLPVAARAQVEVPRASDPRLVVELFAQAPDLVHPVACDFDARGRLLVIESHTHFRPPEYKGPKHDRILMLEDPRGTGRADRITTFYEGTVATMDIATHPDGSVYLATRNEILRLRDKDQDGVADEATRVVFLDTKGNYPHNGLSGLCFDSRGELNFGMGENLGIAYTLIGADGTRITGEGDGGRIFHCTAEGKKLRRVATGFWNPFGNCRDIYGRLFCVDNDPDQSPPCRLHHVVEGGDYGFRYCYGRAGKHPFQSWYGQLAGTLPMMTGVGEAPCEVMAYESDGLPAEYLGQLLVTSWADHRVERYQVQPRGASFKAERLPFIQGGKDFRPTGLALAPDGSLFVADWVLASYNLHGKGAIWHVRWKDAPKMRRPADPKEALNSLHRPLREAAAAKLARAEGGVKYLKTQLTHLEPRVRAAALTAIVDLDLVYPKPIDFLDAIIASKDEDVGLREMALRHDEAANRAHLIFDRWASRILKAPAKYPPRLVAEAIGCTPGMHLAALESADPVLRQAAILQLSRELQRDPGFKFDEPEEYAHSGFRQSALLALQRAAQVNPKDRVSLVPFLNDADEGVRFLAVKWIADDKLADYREHVEKALADPKLSARMYLAYATALARLQGKEITEQKLADGFAERLADDAVPPAQRVQLLRQVPNGHKRLTVELLTRLLTSEDASLRKEAVRALAMHTDPSRIPPLLAIFRDSKLHWDLRGLALTGLQSEDLTEDLVALAAWRGFLLRQDALRALAGRPLSNTQRQLLERMAPAGQALDRVLGKPFAAERPPAKDLDAWLRLLGGPADVDAGARVFAWQRAGVSCTQCHRIDGRGQTLGPDLSNIGTTDRRHLLESLLQPNNTIAPHYQAWRLELADGRIMTGMLIATNRDEYTYADAEGKSFKLNTRDIVSTQPSSSLMPEGLMDVLTDQEIRDLLAYLESRK